MTIESDLSRAGPYLGNGVTTSFPYGFKVYDRSHLQVILTPDGQADQVVDPALYTVSGVGSDGGGSVVFASPPASGFSVSILLNMPFVQETDLENQGAFFAETIERAFDESVQRDLQLQEGLSRAITVPAGTADVEAMKAVVTGSLSIVAGVADDIAALGPIADGLSVVIDNIDAVLSAPSRADDAIDAADRAEDAADRAKLEADTAALFRTIAFDYEGDVRDDVRLGYDTSVTGSVSVGDIISLTGGGAIWRVVDSAATNYDLATSGGVKLARMTRDDFIGTVVVYGSSTLAGGGSTGNVNPSPLNGWQSGPQSVATLLAGKIGSRGRVINRSVAGRSMQDLIDNFWTEVAPYQPRFVVCGTGWVNEPGEPNKTVSYNRRANQLIGMIRQIGAVPIWFAFNPISGNTLGAKRSMHDIMANISGQGVAIWDMGSGTSDDSYATKPQFVFDDAHLNSAGHAAMADAICMADFFVERRPRLPHAGEMESMAVSSASSPLPNIAVLIGAVEDQPKSWTVSTWLMNDGLVDGTQRFIHFRTQGGDGLRINQVGVGADTTLYAPSANLGSLGVKLAQSKAPINIITTYDHIDEVIRVFVDGSLALTAPLSASVGAGLTEVQFAWDSATDTGHAGLAVRDVAVWGKVFRHDGSIHLLYNGERPTTQLLALADMNARGFWGLPNLAGTRVAILTSDSLTWKSAWSGENANGRWYADWDGSLICTGTINLGSSVAQGSGSMSQPYRTNVAAWDHPMAFSSPPITTANVVADQVGGRAMFAVLGEAYATQTSGVQAWRTSDSSNDFNVTVALEAVGRWRGITR